MATVSDRGRSRPHLFTLDATGRAAGHRRAVEGDIVTHSLAASARRADGSATVAYLATDGPRAMELSTVELPGGAPRRRTRIGSAWQDRYAPIEMRLVQAPGAGGPIDVWMATLVGLAPTPGCRPSSMSTAARSGRGRRHPTSR